MQTPTDTYLDDQTYAALRAELGRLIATQYAHDPDTELVRVLGEVGGIWPESVLEDGEPTEKRHS